jgi:hypothetical protein
MLNERANLFGVWQGQKLDSFLDFARFEEPPSVV